MDKKYIGSRFDDAVKVWERKDPTLRAKINEHREKAELAMLLRKTRKSASISQVELAKRAQVPQSFVARIESTNSKTMPRIDIYSKLFNSMGFNIVIGVEKAPRRHLKTA
jgi:ribosome-binding protein aMBF1 (putative translation factor)